MKTHVVVNPNAALFRKRPRLAGEVQKLCTGRAELHVTPTVIALDRAAAEIVANGVERVVLCGGDGSFMAGVTALEKARRHADAKRLPEIVLAPGGTVATVAKNWGQRSGLVKTVCAALADAPLEAIERPTLSVVETGGESRIGFIFGTGLVARFFEKYYATGAGGYAAAARIVSRVFVGSFVSNAYSRSILEPLQCRLIVDGRELEPEAYSLVVSSVVRDLGIHLLVTHRAAEDPSRPHLVASPLPPSRLGPQLPRVVVGKRLKGSDNFDDLVTRFRVRFPGERGSYVLDGDLLSAREVEVSAGPRVRVVSV